MRVFGEAALASFARKHPDARRPLQRFLGIARNADWPQYPAIKQSFPATDYASGSGTLIFDIGGNKYRLIARVDFEEQILYIQSVLTHKEYERRRF